MSYNFKKFEGKEKAYPLKKKIIIRKSKSIGFTKAFCESNNIRDFRYAVFYWDKDKEAIGIHLTNEEEGFKILHSLDFGSQIYCNSFFEENNINVAKCCGKYDWKKYNLEGVGEIFVVELNK